MSSVQILIEGAHAAEAAEALREISGLEVTVESSNEPQKGITWQEVVIIVGIAKTVVDIGKLAKDGAEILLKWHETWKKEKQAIEKAVVLAPDNKRLLLENAQPEEVAKALAATHEK